MNVLWLLKLIVAHLLTDFVFQSTKWIEHRKQFHFASKYLYLHSILTALIAWLFIGFQYWGVAIIIFVTHTIIDGWKSYMPEKVSYFLADQALHLLVILGCWQFQFSTVEQFISDYKLILSNQNWWIVVTAFLFLSFPAGIMIGVMTKKWRDQLPDKEGLADAGKWIGILERSIILIFLLRGKYEAIGLLIAAKGVLRFNDKDRQEAKTEYVLIGSLISIGVSLVTGIGALYLLSLTET